MRQLPLHLKIGIYVAAGLVILFAGLGLLGSYVVNKSTQQVLSSHLAIARLAAFQLDTELREQFDTLTAAAQVMSARLATGASIGSVDVDIEPFTLGVVMVDRSGRLLWTDGGDNPLSAKLAETIMTAPELTRVMNGGPQITTSVLSLTATQPAVALLVPVRSGNGTVYGVIAEAVDPSNPHFSAFLVEAAHLGATGHGELIDANGKVITATMPGHSLETGEHPDLYSSVFANRQPLVGKSFEQEPGQPRGDRHIMAVVPLQQAPWLLAIGGTEAEMLAPALVWKWWILGVGAFALLVALALVWVTTQAIARPVRQLTDATRRLAAGDLHQPVDEHADAEVGELARSFEVMRQRLNAALDALRMEKSRYEATFRFMADALFTVDEQYRIDTFNPAAERLTGMSAAEVQGLHCYEVFQPEAGMRLCQGCPVGADGGNCCQDGNHVQHFATPSGRSLSVAAVASPILGEDGRSVGAVHVMRDVAAREQIDRLKDEFISTISHELRTPLGFIKGFATTLLRRDAAVDARTQRLFLKEIDHASDELQQLIGNILDMSKISASALELDQHPVPVAPLLRDTVARLRHGARDHRFRTSLPRSLPLVRADSRRLAQVLGNLLGNAVKYSPAGSSIVVSARVEGQSVVFSVADEGIGLPDSDLEAVFERFYRSPEARQKGISGTGLGLAICRGIVQGHGGRIWAANRPGGGTVFTFTIPIAAAAEEAGA